MMPGQLLCMDLQSNGVVTSSSADAMGVRKKRWVRTRYLSIASSGLTAGLITVLLVLNSTNKDSKEEPNDRPVYIGAICVKSCRLIPFCVHLSNASKHVFLFNYELLYLKDIVWRPANAHQCWGRLFYKAKRHTLPLQACVCWCCRML